MVNLTKAAFQVAGGAGRRMIYSGRYGELCTIAGFRLAVDTLAYGERTGALGLYNSPGEYLSEVLKEMEAAHAAQAH